MPFYRPNLEDIKKRVKEDIYSRLPQTANKIRNNLLDILSQVYAGISHSLYGAIEFFSRQIFPDTAENEYLDRQGIWRGVYRKQALKSTGRAKFAGTLGTAIPIGFEMKTNDGVRFTTTSSDTIGESLEVILGIEAIEAGANGNLPVGTKLSPIQAKAGLDSDVEITDNIDGEGNILVNVGTTGGTDQESDDVYRSRILATISGETSRYGKADDWIFWVKQTPNISVNYAWEHKNTDNVGLLLINVLRITTDGEIVNIPDTQILEIEGYIYTKAPLGVIWDVYSPALMPLDITTSIFPYTTELETKVKEQTQAFFTDATLNKPGDTITEVELVNHINTKVLGLDTNATAVAIGYPENYANNVRTYHTIGSNLVNEANKNKKIR